MDIIDPHQFIDVDIFVKSAVKISDACFEYRYKKKQDGTTYSFIYNLPFLLVFTTFVDIL